MKKLSPEQVIYNQASFLLKGRLVCVGLLVVTFVIAYIGHNTLHWF